MHPCVLAEALRHHLTIGDSVISWNRPKTRKPIHVPVDPAIASWVGDLIQTAMIMPVHRVTLAQKVGGFGRSVGLVGLTPRGLRHDFAYRVVLARGVLSAREYTGTTTDVLFGYANRQMAAEDAKDPRGLF